MTHSTLPLSCIHQQKIADRISGRARERKKRGGRDRNVVRCKEEDADREKRKRERETIISKNGIEKDITERRMEWNV